MKPIKVRLEHTKDTKGTYVYSTDADDAAVKSQYIQRASVEGEPPKAIMLTIEEAK